MVYLKTPWVDGSDSDYFKFQSLEAVTEYIKEESIEIFVISNEPMDIPEDDYSFVPDFTIQLGDRKTLEDLDLLDSKFGTKEEFIKKWCIE